MDNALTKMWGWIRQTQALTTVPEVPADVPRPELHCCPLCGAGISRLMLKGGGILPRKGLTQVKAQVFCHQCQRQHLLTGSTAFHRGVVLILLDHPRRTYRRAGIYRNGNVR